MPELFVYLIKVNIVLVLFYLAYRFLLRPLTFYTLNRIFLVFGIVFSTAYPFVDLSILFEKNKEFISPQLVNVVNVIPDWQPAVPAAIVQNNTGIVAETFNYWKIPEAIFWIGVLVMSLRLIIQLASLYRLHKRSTAKTAGKHIYRDVSESVNPFSFLRNIYLNAAQLSDKELGSVLEHEQVHVKEWHTLDVLLSELNIIFYWFNPGAWLMKKAVKENLEFIADYRILQQGADSIAYQYDLLNVGLLKQSSPLVNHFSLLTIKQRIIMMNKQRSSRAQVSRYLLALPLVIILALTFTLTKAQLKGKESKSSLLSRQGSVSFGQIQASDDPRTTISRAMTAISSTLRAATSATFPADTTEFSKYLIDGKPSWGILDGKPTPYIVNGSSPFTEVNGEKVYVNPLPPIKVDLAYYYGLTGEAASRLFGPAYASGIGVMVSKDKKDSKEVQDLMKKINLTNDVEYEHHYPEAKPNAGPGTWNYEMTATHYSYGKPLNRKSVDYKQFAKEHPLIMADGSKFRWILEDRDRGALYFIDGKEASEEVANRVTRSEATDIQVALSWASEERIKEVLETPVKDELVFPITVKNKEELAKLSNNVQLLDHYPLTLEVRELSVPLYKLLETEKKRAVILITRKK